MRAFHRHPVLINNGAHITDNGSSVFPPYNVALRTNAGLAGQVAEIIGGYACNGWTYTNLSAGNPVNLWQDYALNSYADLSRTNQYVETPPISPELSDAGELGAARGRVPQGRGSAENAADQPASSLSG